MNRMRKAPSIMLNETKPNFHTDTQDLTHEFCCLVKGHIEHRLALRGWPWDQPSSFLLDWVVNEMEREHERNRN